MSLSKNIYTTSKDFFKQKLTTAFDSTGQSQNINDDQNLFAINCVRYLLADELTFIDPIQKEADFKNFAKFLRLNDFEANGKNLDTGTGREIANNLIYRLAIQFLKTKNDPYHAMNGAHAIAVLTEWEEFKKLDWKRIYKGMQKPAFIFDGRNILNREKLEKIGFNYSGIGK